MAVGICACSGGVFKETYNILGGADQVVPVDVYVPGCAARPESIIDGIVKAIGILDEKKAALKQGKLEEYEAAHAKKNQQEVAQ